MNGEKTGVLVGSYDRETATPLSMQGLPMERKEVKVVVSLFFPREGRLSIILQCRPDPESDVVGSQQRQYPTVF